MEQYREKIKTSNTITAVAAGILVCFSVLFFLSEAGVIDITPATDDRHWQSMWRGFIAGASLGIAGLMIFFLVRGRKALRSQEALKKYYIQAHDERQIQIWTSARATASQIFLLGGLIAGIVAGYFSMAVGITIIACVLIHSLTALACKLYYGKKY